MTKRVRRNPGPSELAIAAAEATKVVATAAAEASKLVAEAAEKAKALVAQPPPYLTEDRISKIVHDAVHEAFKDVGLDSTAPFETQKDMSFLRNWRRLMEKSGHRAFLTVLTIIVLGVVAAFLVGIGVPAKILSFIGLGTIAGPS